MNTVEKILNGLKIRSEQLEKSLELANRLPIKEDGFNLSIIDIEARKDENDCLIEFIENAIEKSL